MTLQNKIYQQRINGINLGEQIGYVVKDPEWQPNTPRPEIPIRRDFIPWPTEYEEDDDDITPDDIDPYNPEWPKRKPKEEDDDDDDDDDDVTPKPKDDWRNSPWNPFRPFYRPDPLPAPTHPPWFPTRR